MTQTTVGASGATWTYTYNNANEMVGASYSATEGGAVTQMVTLVYDAYGNTIEEDYWNGTSTAVTRYGLDGWNPAQPAPLGNENFNDWADLNSSNTLTMRRMFGPGVDEPLVREDSSGNVGWYLTDHLGNVVEITNGSGTPLTTITYNGFGTVLSNSTSSQSDRYLKAGSQYVSALGLWQNDVRFYNGEFWFSEDPKGFAGGDTNLYRYVRNDPTNQVDPSGLAGEIVPTLEYTTYGIGTAKDDIVLSLIQGKHTKYTTVGWSIGWRVTGDQSGWILQHVVRTLTITPIAEGRIYGWPGSTTHQQEVEYT